MVFYILSFIFLSFFYCGSRKRNREIPKKRKITSLDEEIFSDLKIYYDNTTFNEVINSLISSDCKDMYRNSINIISK